MTAPRTVVALEHETIAIGDPADGAITDADANALLALNARRPGFCVRTVAGVRLAQYCGIVRLKTCLIEVLPKLGMAQLRGDDEIARARAALVAMLRGAHAVKIARTDDAAQRTVRAPLLDVFIAAFLDAALERAQRGLIARYVGRVDDLRVIRGRYLARHDTLRNATRPHLAHCDYDEFEADNPYNRAIRAALDACRGWIRQPSLERRWLETCARYDGVARVRMRAGDVARLPRNRTTRHYEPVLRWCELLLSLTSPALSAGDAPMPGLLFDMNRLFEAHVARCETTDAGDDEIVEAPGTRRMLAMQEGEGTFELRPDITVSLRATPGNVVRIVDAKWKRLDTTAPDWDVPQSDIYQMLAYAVRYRCRSIELVFPAPVPLPVATSLAFDIVLADELPPVRIVLRMVSLWN